MASGIRAEVAFTDPDGCPLTRLTAQTGGTCESVSTVVDVDGRVTDEFLLDSAPDPAILDADGEFTAVFAYGTNAVYRYTRPDDHECPRAVVERFGCPPIDVRTAGETLSLTFHAVDMEQLQGVIAALRERYPSLDVRRLLQSETDRTDRHLVFVDRSTLTDRQEEVLETAHRMGYFDHPKGANASEVAAELDITASTYAEHLAAAQRKLLGSILER